MGRSPCCDKIGLKKGPWTPEEDQKLLAYIEEHGRGSWRALTAKAGLQRCGKSCRLRWTNYLRPDIKRGKFSLQEEQTIIQLHALLGNRWSAIATHLPKRTDNEIKNYWNTHLKKRLAKMGIDPVTHKPKSDALSSADGHSKNAANLSHMAQWESARLEAEARLVRESKIRSETTTASPTSPSTTTSFPATTGPCLDVLRAWQGVWSKTNKGGSIDLESPTSTLSFSENNNTTIRAVAADEVADWKCFGNKSMRASDSGNCNEDQTARMEHLGGFPREPSLFGNGRENPWLHESLKHGSGNFCDGFTEMLLEKYSDEQNSSSDGCGADSGNEDNIGGGGGGGAHEYEEDNKSYWNSILNLVNSGSASGSAPLF